MTIKLLKQLLNCSELNTDTLEKETLELLHKCQKVISNEVELGVSCPTCSEYESRGAEESRSGFSCFSYDCEEEVFLCHTCATWETNTEYYINTDSNEYTTVMVEYVPRGEIKEFSDFQALDPETGGWLETIQEEGETYYLLKENS